MSDFNGIASVNIYDKTKSVNTLVNDPYSINNPNGSLPFSFDLQKILSTKERQKLPMVNLNVLFSTERY